MLIDTHAHFDDFRQPGECSAVLDRAQAAGVHRVIAIGGNAEANDLAVALSEADPGRVRAAVGYDRDQAPAAPSLEALRAHLGRPGVVAIGEIGLDYHYAPESVAAQRALMEVMLATSKEYRLPVVIHSRDADEDTVALLRGAEAGGVLHCFTGSREFAKQVLDLGLYISFSGIITFRNAGPLRDVAGLVPDDRLLIETDTPYLAPVPHRGRRNEPGFLVHVAEALAKIRNDTVEHIAHITARNAEQLFGLNPEKKP